MSEQDTAPFVEVLEAVATLEPVPIHLLYRLSDLAGQELAQFKDRWELFSHCFKDAWPQVRIAALDGVWDSTKPALVPEVLDLLQHDEEVEVQAAAAAALAHFIVLAQWGQIPENVAPPIVDALLGAYDRAGTASMLKRATLEALGSAHHPRVAALIADAYESDDPDMQLSALFSMGASADNRWLPTLIEEMDSNSADMREEAARAAGALNDRGAVPELAALTADEDLSVAAAAVQALGQLGGEQAGNILMQLSQDPEFEELLEIVDEALEQVEWLDGSFDYLMLNLDNEFEED
jgi:HEAT repeat protein